MRLYAEHHLAQVYDPQAMQARFGAAYAGLVRLVYRELDRSARLVYLAQAGSHPLESR
jgi:hypothetical protein